MDDMLQIDGFTIRFPARPGYLKVSRLNASAIGAEAGFDVEQLDDLRLAVNETVTWLLADPESGGEIELVLSAQDGQIRIDGTRSCIDSLPDRPLDDLINAILGATVDEHRLSADAAGRTIQLVKSRSGSVGA